MTTDLIDRTDLMTAKPLPVLAAAQADDHEVDHEWQEFLSLGLRVELSAPGGNAGWRNAPVLLSY